MAPSTPLFSPRSYFSRHDRPSLAVGAGVVFVEALVTMVVIWLFLQRVIAHVDVPPAEKRQVQGALTGMLVGVFVAIFVGWLIAAAILHVFVWLGESNEGFGATLAVAGEAELPAVVLTPLITVGLFNLLGQAPNDPAALTAFFERAAAFNSPLLLVVTLVSTGWKAVLQGYGLADVHDRSSESMLVLAFVVGLVGWLLNLL